MKYPKGQIHIGYLFTFCDWCVSNYFPVSRSFQPWRNQF